MRGDFSSGALRGCSIFVKMDHGCSQVRRSEAGIHPTLRVPSCREGRITVHSLFSARHSQEKHREVTQPFSASTSHHVRGQQGVCTPALTFGLHRVPWVRCTQAGWDESACRVNRLPPTCPDHTADLPPVGDAAAEKELIMAGTSGTARIIKDVFLFLPPLLNGL